MGVQIIDGLVTYLANYLTTQGTTVPNQVWESESPRWDVNGNAISPYSSTATAGNWPLIEMVMMQPGFTRTYTCGNDSYYDTGTIQVKVWATTRAAVEALAFVIDGLFEQQVSDMTLIDLGGPTNNPNYVIDMLQTNNWYGQDDNERTSTSQLLYRADLDYQVRYHSHTATTT